MADIVATNSRLNATQLVSRAARAAALIIALLLGLTALVPDASAQDEKGVFVGTTDNLAPGLLPQDGERLPGVNIEVYVDLNDGNGPQLSASGPTTKIGTGLTTIQSDQYGTAPVGSTVTICADPNVAGHAFDDITVNNIPAPHPDPARSGWPCTQLFVSPSTSFLPTNFNFVPAPAVFCDGKLVTINMNTNGGNGFGTGLDDVILGTPGNDTINGLAGDDTVCAGGGDDTVFGGAGADRIFGEAGADMIFGATGNDFVSGGPGDDTVLGQGGLDSLFGIDGDDTLRGNGANDFLFGGLGADRLFGNGGVDEIRGGPGLDQIWGGNLGDFLFGEGTRCLLYTSPSPRDATLSRMPSSA